MPRVYLAGPDVFAPDAAERGERMKSFCSGIGFDARFPADFKQAEEIHATRQAFAIYNACRYDVEQADVVIANLTPFRGPSCDVGTAVEVGMALALGKPVVGWAEYPAKHSVYAARVDRNLGLTSHDADGNLIEDFGLADNLMVVCGLSGPGDGHVFHSFEGAACFAALMWEKEWGRAKAAREGHIWVRP